MKEKTFVCRPIGIIHSPFRDTDGMPIQTTGARGVPGTIAVDERYREGLRDLDGFSHLILLYHFHLSRGYSLVVKPFLDDSERGLFATRAPRRPNPIGLSVVRLVRVEGTLLHVEDVDIVDGTPLLDLKPFVPLFDDRQDVKTGWLDGRGENAFHTRADRRFRS
ncbi:MAG TPA: tRNA (N6-threonylcarbamoyladenosine(37)-N6)-methyltransferase TrmO [Syntrophales bacterium]|nr:tRNA (N6-threonylcarbamoyladenosine(37)-N6)-methyltransferase TrmO [Syntrophales bacterium]HQN78577.1 tRNA (N6-threonylcarbamoyladenosine(37)-N6)-methyltransferase TrmO [Syntrophales bacterium]HQQ27613.1 tRNA (N6-threonylcarbamoyladenosine(37)-N6)-methyltransferase TrmO [Syntrophales bacterium]